MREDIKSYTVGAELKAGEHPSAEAKEVGLFFCVFFWDFSLLCLSRLLRGLHDFSIPLLGRGGFLA